ncbi:MAG TPA: MFS transporter [Acidimicrobiales bacterium]|jgi:MFS family permease|nr:MFS transporter [Acidimicrobiales bacterium]
MKAEDAAALGPPATGAGLTQSFHLHGWSDRAVVAVAFVALAAGVGQFGLAATLGDVAHHFGHITRGSTVADRAGLSGTELGLGLAVVRLASLGGLPVAGLADRIGRRRVMLFACGLGLALTAVSALGPGFWWFVVIFALGRPFLSAAAAIAQVQAAEQTRSGGRASAVALVAAGYAVGAGLTAVVYGLAGGTIGYRGILVMAVLPLVALPFLSHSVTETGRFEASAAAGTVALPVVGAVARPYRRRLFLVAAVAFSLAVITGPSNTFVFAYAQNIEGFPGIALSGMVVAAGLLGLGGLLAGRWLADRVGRRPTATGSMLCIGASGVLCYSGNRASLVLGYLAGITAAGVFAPAAGAFANELFPTAVRSSVAGWNVAASVIGAGVGLVAFGAVADVGHRFGPAALVTFLPAMCLSGLIYLLPETLGHEPEWFWPPEGGPPTAPVTE